MRVSSTGTPWVIWGSGVGWSREREREREDERERVAARIVGVWYGVGFEVEVR